MRKIYHDYCKCVLIYRKEMGETMKIIVCDKCDKRISDTEKLPDGWKKVICVSCDETKNDTFHLCLECHLAFHEFLETEESAPEFDIIDYKDVLGE